MTKENIGTWYTFFLVVFGFSGCTFLAYKETQEMHRIDCGQLRGKEHGTD